MPRSLQCDRLFRRPAPKPNHLLAALPVEIQQRVAARGEVVPLVHKSVVIVPDTPIEYAYFPRSGCISLVSVMADGSNVEIGTIGWEGMCGVSLIHGFSSVPAKAIIQIPGDALRIPAEELASMVQEEESLQSVLLRYAQLWATPSAATARATRFTRWKSAAPGGSS